MDNKTFALNLDEMTKAVDRFSIDECGRLFSAIYEYQSNGTIPTKDYLKESYYLFIEYVVPQLEEDALLSDEERYKKMAQQMGGHDVLV